MHIGMKIAVTGIGWVTPEGIGRGRDYTSLPGGKGPIPAPTRKMAIDEPFAHFGRLDGFSKIGFTAIGLTLKDAGRDAWKEERNVGLIASTYSGCLSTDTDYFDTVVEEGGHLASPNLFAYTLPNSFLGEAAIHFGLTGTSFILCEEDLTGLQGLCFAIQSLLDTESDAVLAGICDIGSPDPLTVRPVPLQGALFCLLEKADRPNRSSYGEIRKDGAGGIYLNGNQAKDMFGLIQICLRTNTGS